MAGQTAQEQQLARAFLMEGGWPDTATNEQVVTAWMRAETNSGTTGVGAAQNNVLGLRGGGSFSTGTAGGFNTYASAVDSMKAAADRLKSTQQYGYPTVVAAFAAGNDPAYVIRVLSQSDWDSGHYAWNPLTGGKLQGLFQQLGGNLYAGTPLTGVGQAEANTQGAIDSAAAVLGFGAQAAAFVADPQNWLRIGALLLGVILTGAGGYILWQAT